MIRSAHLVSGGADDGLSGYEMGVSGAGVEPGLLRSRAARQAAWAAVGLLTVRNLGGVVLPGWAYIPANVATGGALVWVARRAGITWEQIGLARRWWRPGIRLGGAVAALAAAVMAVGAVLPATSRFFDDERVEVGEGWQELVYQAGVRIPVGTVAFEELAFRGVLLAVLARSNSLRTAMGLHALLFGLWHVRPTLGAAYANDIVGAPRLAMVAGAVLATGVGGAFFAALRLRGGHLVAPVLVHLAFNDTGYLLGWWIRS